MNIKLGLVLVGATLALSGCATSRNMLGLGDNPAPASAPVIQTNNPLALPPDLALKRPGSAPAYQPNTVNTANLDDGSEPPLTPAPLAPAPKQDIWAEYGISKTKPDGTPKDATQLQKELRAAILKRKQQQNPGYGTIRNMGAIFSDG